jgi:DNA-binding transcriptional ArsR family regulator
MYSLGLLSSAQKYSGFSAWVNRTAATLTPSERETLHLIYIGFYFIVMPDQSWPSFPAFVDSLASEDPVVMRDGLLERYVGVAPQDEVVKDDLRQQIADGVSLRSAESYLDFLRQCFGEKNLDLDIETRAYTYLVDPPAMQKLIVSHLRSMWEKHLAHEWLRVEPMLQDAVAAFRQVNMSRFNRLDAIEWVTGQSLAGKEGWQERLERVERIVFVPSAHVGPYLGIVGARDQLWVLFGARLPEGVQYHAPALSRNEIVMRLTALADDIRLSILKSIFEEGELSSPEIMERLDLSQSAASRHLKQLSATGYLVERRCNGAKCYTLNPKRIRMMLQAVETYLLG